jgi:hypothetical protein
MNFDLPSVVEGQPQVFDPPGNDPVTDRWTKEAIAPLLLVEIPIG